MVAGEGMDSGTGGQVPHIASVEAGGDRAGAVPGHRHCLDVVLVAGEHMDQRPGRRCNPDRMT